MSAFTFAGRIRSFRFAIRGAAHMLRSQHNAWLHAAASGAVIAVGCGLHISRMEWCAIAMSIALVWVAEGMNTAFEFLCDVASPAFHPTVEKAKDVAAGAVLIAALGAIVVGTIVFAPHVMHHIRT